MGVAFAKSMGIDPSASNALAALRALPADKIVDGLNMASMGKQADTYGGPILDGIIVTQTPQQALRSGHYWKIPVMIGANSADIGFPLWHTLNELWTAFGPDAKDAQAAFDPTNSGNFTLVGWSVAAGMMMIEPSRFVASEIAAAGLPSYEYRFSYVAASLEGKVPGAFHATEIPFVFDTVAAKYGDQLAPADEAIARQANEYWTNFGKTGDPNGPGLPYWPAYNSSKDELMNFTEDGPVGEADPWKVRLDLVERMVQRQSAVVDHSASAAEAKPTR